MSERTEQIRYEIVRKIARGGMGEVFLARQISYGGFAKDVVLKRIHENLADDPDFVEQFLEEARIAAMLDHPNIVQILGLGQQERDHFIVMEYVQGLSLSRLIKRVGGPLPLPIAVQITIGIAAGLEYAHEALDPGTGESLNLVHRDVSPPNILVSTSGDVKITDFGIAKVKWSTNKTRAGVVKGKYSYLSPEQVRGKKATRQSDIYSLGLNLYEMVTGQRAYPTGEHADVLRAVARGKIAPPDKHVPNFPADLEEVLMRALAVNPKHRYTSCAQLQEDLQALLQSWEITLPPSKVGTFVGQVIKGEPITELPAVEGPTQPGVGEPYVSQEEAEELEDLDDLEALSNQDTQIVEMTTVHLTPPVVELPPDLSGEQPAADLARAHGESPVPLSPPAVQGGIIDARQSGAPEEPTDEVSPPDLTDPTLKTRAVRSRRSLLVILALFLALGAVVTIWMLISPDAPTAEDPTGSRVTGNIVHSSEPGAEPGGGTPATPSSGLSPSAAKGQSADTPSVPSPDAASLPPPDGAIKDLASMPPPDRSAAVPSPPPRQPRRPRGPTVELSISSDPKTTVYRGSRRLGVTPLKIRIPKTKTKFLLRNRKKGIRTTRVITPHGSRISAHFVFRKGKIGFRTSTRCEVRLGRKRLGITPLSPVEVYEGKHKVLLVEKRGGRRHRRTVDVMPGRTVWVEVK